MAERLNAAVSKTVTSVIPASGVRIPPSPLLELVSRSVRRLEGGSQLVSKEGAVRYLFLPGGVPRSDGRVRLERKKAEKLKC